MTVTIADSDDADTNEVPKFKKINKFNKNYNNKNRYIEIYLYNIIFKLIFLI